MQNNKEKYILATLDGSVDLRRKNATAVHELLTSKGYDLLDGDFKYLIKMPMDSVTQENVDKILKEKSDAETELEILKKTTLEAMWLSELEHLQKEYNSYKKVRESIQNGETKQTKKVVKKKVVKK